MAQNNLPSNAAPGAPGIGRRIMQAVQYTIAGITPSTWMSPLQPLPPMTQETKGRLWDFPVAFNLNYIPRSYEPLKFGDLLTLAEGGIVREVIETRKDQMKNLEWIIKPKELKKGQAVKSPKFQNEIHNITDFLAYPNKMLDWSQWLGEVLEQHFVYDALAVERVRTRNGSLAALKIIDGATVGVKLDQNGETPEAPAVAYQQVLKGLPAIDFTTDELLYYPRNRRAGRAYGFSHVAQIAQYVEMCIKRTREQIAYYDHGNRPHGLMQGGPNLTPDEVEGMQNYWEAMFSGNIEQRAKVWWVPNGTEYKPFVNDILFDEFDEWLARVVCYCFSISPQPFVKMMNRGTAQSASEQSASEGLQPTMQYVKNLMDIFVRNDFQQPELEFVWVEDNEFDPSKKAVIDNVYVRAGVKAIDELRDSLGLDPIGGAAATPMFATPNGYVSIEPMQEQQPMGLPTPLDANGKPTPQQGSQNANGKTQTNAAQQNKQQANAKAPAAAKAPQPKAAAKRIGAVQAVRKLVNEDDLMSWLARIGFTPVSRGIQFEVVDSVVPIDLDDWPTDDTSLVLVEGGLRKVEYADGMIKLSFESQELLQRSIALLDKGIGISAEAGTLNIPVTPPSNMPTEEIAPYDGPLLFGEEEVSGNDPFIKMMTGDEVDAAANETDPDPSKAQIEAGNYKKGKLSLYGLSISIENPAGSTRSGTDPDGKEWESEVPNHYGYILGYIDNDGDNIDVFVGSRPDSGRVFVIDQVDDDGEFDEHKVFLGFMGPKPVLSCFIDAYKDAEEKDPGEAHHKFGDMRELTVAEFKDWLENGDLKEPIADQNVGEEVPYKIRNKKPEIVEKDVTVATGMTHYDQGYDRRRSPFENGTAKIYRSVGELPESVVEKITSPSLRRQFMHTYNSIITLTGDESRALSGAWAQTDGINKRWSNF